MTQHRTAGFGRRHAADPRDWGVAPLPLLPYDRSRYWAALPALDQGQTPECTVYSTATAIMAAPYEHRDLLKRVNLGDVYDQAKTLDEWDGEAYDGTSVRAACKAWQARGFITEYRWASTIEEVLSLLVNVGVVVVGTDFTSGMETPNSSGVIHATGDVVGGHAYSLIGYDHAGGNVRMLNSWGTGWGQRGRAWLPVDDLAKLLSNQGEAAVLLDVAAAEFNKLHPVL